MNPREADVLISINDIGPLAATLTIDDSDISVVESVGPIRVSGYVTWRLRVPHLADRQMRRLQALIAAGLAPAADQPVEVRIHAEYPGPVYSGRAWATYDMPHDLKEPELCHSLALECVGTMHATDH